MPSPTVNTSTHGIYLLNEGKHLHGSYAALARALGVPWSTMAMVSSGRMPPSPALVLGLSLMLGRAPLQDLARVELQAGRDTWSGKLWRKLLDEADQAAA